MAASATPPATLLTPPTALPTALPNLPINPPPAGFCAVCTPPPLVLTDVCACCLGAACGAGFACGAGAAFATALPPAAPPDVAPPAALALIAL